MSDHEGPNSTIGALGKALALQDQAARALSGGPMTYYLEKVLGYADALFNRFAPARRGDRVILTGTPKAALDPTTHWYGLRDLMHTGATGVVGEVDYFGGEFGALIKFDADTDGKWFYIRESCWRKVQ